MDAALPLPIIYQYRCTGCGDCVEQCPTGALGIRDGKAVITHPDQCIYCTLCEDVCPEEAIALPFLVIFGEQRHQE